MYKNIAGSGRQEGETSLMQTGQEFNPYKVFVGIFIPNAIVKCQSISPGAKLLYGRLAQYAGGNGDAYPSHETLAVELGVSSRQIRRYISELVNERFVRVQHTQKSNRYIFLWHEVLEQSLRGNLPTRTDMSTPAGQICPPQEDGYVQGRDSLKDLNKERVDQQEKSPAPAQLSLGDEKPKGAVNELIGYYINLYRERFGYDYPVAKGKDHGCIKNLVNEHGPELVRKILKEHVNTKDQWIIDRGCSLTTIQNSLPEYLNKINKAKAEEEAEARQREIDRQRQEQWKREEEEKARERAEYEALPEVDKIRRKLENDLMMFETFKKGREEEAEAGNVTTIEYLLKYARRVKERLETLKAAGGEEADQGLREILEEENRLEQYRVAQEIKINEGVPF